MSMCAGPGVPLREGADDFAALLAAPALDPLFWPSARPGVLSAWYGHVPFAHWLVGAARPRLLVELGTHNGVSYAAFCESVLRNALPTRCFAVDTWEGDIHAGHYGDEVHEALKRFHDGRYAGFSAMLRMTFDEALGRFEDGTVDVLHIDGLHTYEAVRHDFESWSPKLSPRAVVLFHDIRVRERGFGVWRLWEEVRGRYPGFTFDHSYGLGVLAVGPEVPPAIAALCAADSGAVGGVLRGRFARLGEPDGLCAGLLHQAGEIEALRQQIGALCAVPPQPQAATLPAAAETRLKLGIGIVTYNRASQLLRAVRHVLDHTRHPHELVIADDGSTDGTAEAVAALAGTGVSFVTARNMGVNWNKNRLLFQLGTMRACDVVILLEDDSFPVLPGWEAAWIAAARKWGHVNNAGEWFASRFTAGSGTLDDPFESDAVSAQCAAFSREAIAYVGFFDPELGRFGGAHGEHSYRMARAGYGGRFHRDGEIGMASYYLIRGDIAVTQENSGFESEDAEGFRKYFALRDGPIHRWAWRTDAEREQFQAEMRAIRIL